MAPDVVVRCRKRRPGGIPARRALLRRGLALFLLPFLLSGSVPAPGALAQDAEAPAALDGRTVQAIELRGVQALSEETLLYYLGIAVGQPLDEQLLNQKVKELWDRSLIDDVQVEAAAVADRKSVV